MAIGHSITPFPDDIDRDYFGAYLSGLVDGEGHFALQWEQSKDTGCAAFVIRLRTDDLAILDMIRSFLGCGRIWTPKKGCGNSSPTSRFAVRNLPELVGRVIPQFDSNPLLAKKARDFRIWKGGVSFLHAIRSRKQRRRPGYHAGFRRKWADDDKAYFRGLVADLSSQRLFGSAGIVAPTARGPRESQLSLF